MLNRLAKTIRSPTSTSSSSLNTTNTSAPHPQPLTSVPVDCLIKTFSYADTPTIKQCRLSNQQMLSAAHEYRQQQQQIYQKEPLGAGFRRIDNYTLYKRTIIADNNFHLLKLCKILHHSNNNDEYKANLILASHILVVDFILILGTYASLTAFGISLSSSLGLGIVIGVLALSVLALSLSIYTIPKPLVKEWGAYMLRWPKLLTLFCLVLPWLKITNSLSSKPKQPDAYPSWQEHADTQLPLDNLPDVSFAAKYANQTLHDILTRIKKSSQLTERFSIIYFMNLVEDLKLPFTWPLDEQAPESSRTALKFIEDWANEPPLSDTFLDFLQQTDRFDLIIMALMYSEHSFDRSQFIQNCLLPNNTNLPQLLSAYIPYSLKSPYSGYTLLHWAILKGDARLTKTLLDLGADLDLPATEEAARPLVTSRTLIEEASSRRELHPLVILEFSALLTSPLSTSSDNHHI